jgi:hypothetical protein
VRKKLSVSGGVEKMFSATAKPAESVVKVTKISCPARHSAVSLSLMKLDSKFKVMYFPRKGSEGSMGWVLNLKTTPLVITCSLS